MPMEATVVVGHRAKRPLENNLLVSWISSSSFSSLHLLSRQIVAATQTYPPLEVKEGDPSYGEPD